MNQMNYVVADLHDTPYGTFNYRLVVGRRPETPAPENTVFASSDFFAAEGEFNRRMHEDGLVWNAVGRYWLSLDCRSAQAGMRRLGMTREEYAAYMSQCD